MNGTHADPEIVDRPFVFAIVDEQTGSLLFLGSIVDPQEGDEPAGS